MKQPMSIDFLQYSKFPSWFLAGALLAVTSMPAAATSISVPGASYGAQVNFAVPGTAGITEPALTTTGNISFSADPSNSGTAAAGILANPFPVLSATESLTEPTPAQLGSYVQHAYSGASMVYWIEFTGPTATVPIQVNALLSTSFTGASLGSDVEANFAIGTNGGPTVLQDQLVDGAGTTYVLRGVSTPVLSPQKSLTLNDSGIWIANTNTLYGVALSASAETFSSNWDVQDDLQSGSGSAFVDPTFQIASSVADPQDYSIILSSGVGNTPATTSIAPEPTTATLALCGAFATVCGVFRRRMKARGRSC